MNVAGVSSLGAYVRLIREQPEEAVALMKDLLISVTHFFRDTDAFKALEERVIPRLFDNKGPGDQVRVWVPGLRDGRRGLLGGDAARRVRRRPERSARGPGVRHRSRRGCDRRSARGLLYRVRRRRPPREAARAIFPPRRHRLSHPAGASRNDAVRASQRHQGSAVLARRSDLVPESADLSQPDGAAADPRDVSFRPAPWRIPAARSVGVAGERRRSLHGRRSKDQSLSRRGW